MIIETFECPICHGRAETFDAKLGWMWRHKCKAGSVNLYGHTFDSEYEAILNWEKYCFLVQSAMDFECVNCFDEGYDVGILSANDIVYCKYCEYRVSEDCPMYHEEWISYDSDGYLESDIVIYDNTEDNGFCHKGKRSEEYDD